MLPIANRIRKNSEFAQVFETGVKVYADSFFVVAAVNTTGDRRYGFVVSSKVGNSVVRHRMARKLRETFRHTIPADGVDILVVARPGFDSAFDDKRIRDVAGKAVTKLRRRG